MVFVNGVGKLGEEGDSEETGSFSLRNPKSDWAARASHKAQPRILRSIYASGGSRALADVRSPDASAPCVPRGTGMAGPNSAWFVCTRALDAAVPSEWREDPWLVALHTFEPCYIGGWSACEHWHLTEQIFRGIVVFTTHRVRSVATEIQGFQFRVRHTRAEHMFGLRKAWRRNFSVPVSDPSRTVVDILNDPATGGGIRHVSDVLRAYFESEHRDDDALLGYSARLGNATVFKRLGFLIETLEIDAPALIEASLAKRSKGITLLDPSVKRHGRILSRWNLSVNVSVDVHPR